MAALLGDRRHALAKDGIVRPGRLVSHAHATTATDDFTCPQIAYPEGIAEIGDSFPLGRGRDQAAMIAAQWSSCRGKPAVRNHAPMVSRSLCVVGAFS